MQEQNSTLELSSTPNARGTQGTPENTPQQSLMSPRTNDQGKKDQYTTKISIKDSTEQTEPKNKGTELSAKQLTLANRLSSDRRYLDREEGWNGISPHGPSHQGPRVLLIVHQEDGGTR